MRKVLRFEDNQVYWDRRWTEAGNDADRFDDFSIYPIKYAEMVMDRPDDLALELGVGLGRVLKHYHPGGRKITGVELSEVAVRTLSAENPAYEIHKGDPRDLPFRDAEFDVVLAFGVYHNIEDGLERALSETGRVLKDGGRFCISMSPDNFEMRLNEQYWRRKQRSQQSAAPKFHKWLVGEKEFRRTLFHHQLETDQVYRARNVSLLYRIPWLRADPGSETERRAKGYRLNTLGRAIDRLLVSVMPSQFCNLLVFIGHKGA